MPPTLTRIRRVVAWTILLGLVGLGSLLLYGHARSHPEDLPWTELDLSQPVGAFTGRKLAGLSGKGETCRALLDRAGIAFVALPPRSAGDGQCGHDDAIRFGEGGSLSIDWRPPGLGTSCPVAAALALWEWHVVQPAALRRLGAEVTRIEHFGSYSCRRVGGGEEGNWSEHARANAVDIAAFVLSDGTRVSVIGDWDEDGGSGPRARFLREVRDGACDLFATVLSPDYNAAHRDHLHFDQAERGAFGWRGCR